MTYELSAVMATVLILAVLLMLQGALVPLSHGFKWGLGPRDEPRVPSIAQGRAARTVANHIEAMMLFVPLVVVAHLAGVSNEATVLGALLFVISRAAYSIVYLAGIPVLRSVAWTGGIVGIGIIALEVIRAVPV